MIKYHTHTSEKSFISAFLIADSAIQFLSTYLGFTSVRHFSQLHFFIFLLKHHHIAGTEVLFTLCF